MVPAGNQENQSNYHRGHGNCEQLRRGSEAVRAPDEEQATRYLDGSETTTYVAVDHTLVDAREAGNRSWNRLRARTID